MATSMIGEIPALTRSRLKVDMLLKAASSICKGSCPVWLWSATPCFHERRLRIPRWPPSLKYEYYGILSFLQRVDDRDKRNGGKMSIPQIEELAFQAKKLTDQ